MSPASKSQEKLNNCSTKGFTLVELLIAISLIGILTGVLLAVLNPRGIQAKARDSQRISDLSKVKVALESYFSDNRGYPTSGSNWVLVNSISGLATAYINILPIDPKTTGTICNSASAWRGYAYKSNGNSYLLATNMEIASMGTTGCPNSTLGCNCGFFGGTAFYTTAD
ncbi:hypothetical protein COT50_03235 [candidate division WWE3 bacterium CG08_land_8_20_14_0_20_41_10]|uniref:Type II secretion system protein GspG C-terminal domain-containing protein n=1 Tax=candidate division WWE3 bacterium CG08_land_8_20_14_0_20_41_10 TaxID=1975085 RepID=A0A2H0XBB9_UNCKA|nr:MAG: hypothetical protein COT50_03235 [candidate division WWE3 bacterium CG08_land_8_20_14_0_20_41_10]